jgi:hypothetical protein
MTEQIENSPRMRRVIQTVCDFTRKPLNKCRIADLGSAHGQISLELARRGASVLGIEGRDYWVDLANKNKLALGLNNVEFLKDDIRNLTEEKYGKFDIIVCAGVLYHLDTPDVFILIENMHAMCTNFLIVDTHVARQPNTQTTWRGQTYSGWMYQEHAPGADVSAKAAALGASLSDEQSFWPSFPSLLNALRHAGFSSVVQSKIPLDNLYVNGEFKMHSDTVALLAMKGQPIQDYFGMTPGIGIDDWPEDPSRFYWQRSFHSPRDAECANDPITGTVSPA